MPRQLKATLNALLAWFAGSYRPEKRYMRGAQKG